MTTNNGTTPQTAEEMVTALRASIAAVKPWDGYCADGKHKVNYRGQKCHVCGPDTSEAHRMLEKAEAIATANRVALATRLCGGDRFAAQLDALDSLIANLGKEG